MNLTINKFPICINECFEIYLHDLLQCRKQIPYDTVVDVKITVEESVKVVKSFCYKWKKLVYFHEIFKYFKRIGDLTIGTKLFESDFLGPILNFKGNLCITLGNECDYEKSLPRIANFISHSESVKLVLLIGKYSICWHYVNDVFGRYHFSKLKRFTLCYYEYHRNEMREMIIDCFIETLLLHWLPHRKLERLEYNYWNLEILHDALSLSRYPKLEYLDSSYLNLDEGLYKEMVTMIHPERYQSLILRCPLPRNIFLESLRLYQIVRLRFYLAVFGSNILPKELLQRIATNFNLS